MQSPITAATSTRCRTKAYGCMKGSLLQLEAASIGACNRPSIMNDGLGQNGTQPINDPQTHSTRQVCRASGTSTLAHPSYVLFLFCFWQSSCMRQEAMRIQSVNCPTSACPRCTACDTTNSVCSCKQAAQANTKHTHPPVACLLQKDQYTQVGWQTALQSLRMKHG